MQHPIGEHALLADSRTAALVDPDGNVAWLCWPRIDSTPLLFSLLDVDRGGAFAVRPARPDARVVSRRYLARSLVLETVWEVGVARLIVEDALDLGDGPLLIRRLRTEGADVDVSVTVTAPDWPGARGSLRAFGNVLELDGGAGVAVHAPSEWQPHSAGTRSAFTVHPGSAATVILATAGIAPRAPSIAATLAAWHEQLPSFHNVSAQPHLDELIETTAAVLLGLRRRDAGIVAAPTTSLPQWPGSSRTWDYRYSWLRDTSLAALAMLRLGLLGDAASLGAFIGNVVNEFRAAAPGAHRRHRCSRGDRDGGSGRIPQFAPGQDRKRRSRASATRCPGRGHRARDIARRCRRAAGRTRRVRCRSWPAGSCITGPSRTTGSGKSAGRRAAIRTPCSRRSAGSPARPRLSIGTEWWATRPRGARQPQALPPRSELAVTLWRFISTAEAQTRPLPRPHCSAVSRASGPGSIPPST